MTELRIPDLAARLWTGGAPRDDLVTRVCAALRAQIADNALPAGTRLPSEALLAKELKISRPTLREATRILASRRLARHPAWRWHVRRGRQPASAQRARFLCPPCPPRSAPQAAWRACGASPSSRSRRPMTSLTPWKALSVARWPASAACGWWIGTPLALAAEYLPLSAADFIRTAGQVFRRLPLRVPDPRARAETAAQRNVGDRRQRHRSAGQGSRPSSAAPRCSSCARFTSAKVIGAFSTRSIITIARSSTSR